MVKVSFSGYTIYMRLFLMKECDAIRPGLNCFISMIISVDTLCGFAPSAFSPPASPMRNNCSNYWHLHRYFSFENFWPISTILLVVVTFNLSASLGLLTPKFDTVTWPFLEITCDIGRKSSHILEPIAQNSITVILQWNKKKLLG